MVIDYVLFIYFQAPRILLESQHDNLTSGSEESENGQDLNVTPSLKSVHNVSHSHLHLSIHRLPKRKKTDSESSGNFLSGTVGARVFPRVVK